LHAAELFRYLERREHPPEEAAAAVVVVASSSISRSTGPVGFK